jgi:hypothetical protein
MHQVITMMKTTSVHSMLCILVFCYCLLWPCAAVDTSFHKDPDFISLHAQIQSRLDTLHDFALKVHMDMPKVPPIKLGQHGVPIPRHCPGTKHHISHAVDIELGIISAQKQDTQETSNKKPQFVVITEFQFGNTGNQFVEMIHGLWLAERMGATLVVPKYMLQSLKAFDLSTLHASFCFIQEQEFVDLEGRAAKDSIVKIDLESEESFFFFKIFQKENHVKRYPAQAPSPALSPVLIEEMSLHFLRVVACFWAHVNHNLVSEASHLIHKQLHSNLNYTSVHKRSMEGGCSKLLNANTVQADYNPKQLPMDSPEWAGNLGKAHPVCEYTLSFVHKTIALFMQQNGKGNLNAATMPIFLAWDGRGSVDDYRTGGQTALSVDHVKKEDLSLDGNTLKLLDMFVAMHADLFILNPRSTFSWQIYCVRVILGLQSVPVMERKDLFVTKKAQYDALSKEQNTYLQHDKGSAGEKIEFDGRWVSWTSVQRVMHTYRSNHQLKQGHVARRGLHRRAT